MHWRGSSTLGVLGISRPVPFWLGAGVGGFVIICLHGLVMRKC